jgi:hypothetical protein
MLRQFMHHVFSRWNRFSVLVFTLSREWLKIIRDDISIIDKVMLSFKIRINHLDGKPVTTGRLTLEVTGRRFNKKSLGTLIRQTYTVKNGLISVVFSNVPIYTDTLNFKVSLRFIDYCTYWFSSCACPEKTLLTFETLNLFVINVRTFLSTHSILN